MDDQTKRIAEKVIGDTRYIVESEVSDTAKETPYDKLKRLIINETNGLNENKAS